MYCIIARILDPDRDNTQKCVSPFLEDLSSIANLYVCTSGKIGYCNKVVDLIDPDEKYFVRRRVHSTDGVGKKELANVFKREIIETYGDNLSQEEFNGHVERMRESTLIIDDSRHVWEEESMQ